MDIKQLEYFIATAEARSFYRAAELMYVSQSTMSYQISALENELGHKLFIRDARNVTITAFGEVILEPVKNILKIINTISCLSNRFEALSRDENERETLNLGICDGIEHWMNDTAIQVVSEFIRIEKNVIPNFYQYDFYTGIEALQNNEADIILLPIYENESLPPEISYHIISQDHFILAYKVCDDVKTIKDVIDKLQLTFIPNRMRGGYSRIFNGFKSLGYNPKVYECNFPSINLAMCKAGRLAMIWPKNWIDSNSDPELSFFELPSESFHLSYVFAWNRNNKNPVICKFLSLINAI